MNQRLNWIDYIKVLCISLMVLCHVGMRGYVHQMIYAFHMPMFYLISGYLYKQKDWKMTLRCFMVPIVVISFFRLIYTCVSDCFLLGGVDFWSVFSYENFYKSHTGKASLFTGQWFVITLMLCRFVLGDVKLIGRYTSNYKFLGLVCLLWMSIQHIIVGESEFQYYYPYLCLAALPFMCFGRWLKERGLRNITTHKYTLAALSILFIVIATWNGEVDMSMNIYGKNYFFLFMTTLTSFVLLVWLFQRLPRNGIIETYAQGTLVILGTHLFIYKIFIDFIQIVRLCVR